MYAYDADVFCDDCGQQIKYDIATRISEGSYRGDLTDLIDLDACNNAEDVWNALGELGVRDYDSDDYPKWGSDDAEADYPQHCGNGEDCHNAEVLPNGRKIGALFGELTGDGVEYVREAISNGGPVAELWETYYDWL